MYEDIGQLIGEGFSTWRNNLNLCIPFLLNVVFSVLAMIPLIAVVIATLGMTNIESQSVERLASIVMDSLPSIIPAFLVTILLITIVGAFFEAGAIGMAQQATEEGRAQIGSMWISGKRNLLSMLLMSIIAGLITMAGIVFLLPGILALPRPLMLQNYTPDPQTIGLLALGFILLMIYAIILSIILAIAPYALVVENLGPVDAIKASLRFFGYNKFDVFVLWIIIVAISIGLQMIGSSISVGSNTAAQPLSLITGLVNLLVLAPLSTVWWTRLYLSRTGKMLYKKDASGDLYGTQ
ncbi:MAG: hypothetical protein ACE14P_11110 [Methanotrichaceae archaeon]